MHVTGAARLNNLVTLQRFLDAEDARDWPTWSSCLRPDVTYHAVGSDVVISGADAYVHHMQAAYATLSDWSFVSRNIAESGAAIFVEFDGSGTTRERIVHAWCQAHRLACRQSASSSSRTAVSFACVNTWIGMGSTGRSTSSCPVCPVSNRRVNLTNHGPDSKLESQARVAVVCRLRAGR